MKVFIAVLCLVGTTSIQEELFIFKNIERYWTICLNNKVFYTRNQSEPTQDIKIKQTIDEQHKVLVSSELKHTGSGKIVYRKESFDVCIDNSYKPNTLEAFVDKLFKSEMLPNDGVGSCPIEPVKYQIHRRSNDRAVFIDKKIPVGRYELSYTVKSYDGELIFSPLKFRMSLKRNKSSIQEMKPQTGCMYWHRFSAVFLCPWQKCHDKCDMEKEVGCGRKGKEYAG